jgi:hypothetical protein
MTASWVGHRFVRMKKTALTPLLLALASLLYIYSGGASIVSPTEIFRPVIVVWVLILLLYPLAYWLTRDWNWAGLLMAVIVLGFFARPGFVFDYLGVLLASLLLLVLIYRHIYKKTIQLRHVYLVVNSLSIVTILFISTFLAGGFAAIPDSYYKNTWDVLQGRKYVTLNAEAGAKPDVYYIVLDGYGRSDILQKFYGLDNTEFIDYLQQKGFVVPEKNRSNYPRTVLSVTSTLNMNYIDHFTPQLEGTNITWILSPWLNHNLVRTSLERIGYSSVSISDDWSFTDLHNTDIYFKSHPIILSDFERYIFSVTPLKTFLPYLQHLMSVPTYESHRQNELNNFSSLTRIPAIKGPKFVFAHILLPHPPFIFNSDGSPTNPAYPYSFEDSLVKYPGPAEEYQQNYIGQVQFLNSQLEQVIDSILTNSTQPPIIILQADHGPRMLTDYQSFDNTCLEETFSNFSAYYLPGMEPGKVPDDITPVNVFRILFDEYFDARLPLLSNDQYYPNGEAGSVYSFDDVTGIVERRENCSAQ